MSNFDLIVIKLGALGDVIRTTYLVKSYAEVNQTKKILWITRRNAVDLVRNIPGIEVLDLESLPNILHTSVVFSLDDEAEALGILKKIRYEKLIGAYLGPKGDITYTLDSAPWFDMGLISRFGKSQADFLKRENLNSHAEIFSKILGLKKVTPFFFGDKVAIKKWSNRRNNAKFILGINPFSGKRWPSKELKYSELLGFLGRTRDYFRSHSISHKIVLFSDGSNAETASALKDDFPHIETWDTSGGLLEFAAAIANCDYVVTADSLGLHLAIAQNIPNLSYYAPTSANEIDTFGTGVKVISTAADYCSYKPNADNASLTSARIFNEWAEHIKNLGLFHGK